MNEYIPMFSLQKQNRWLKNEMMYAIEEVIESSEFSGGGFVQSFEKRFAKYNEIDYACCVNSGTSALHLSLLAAGIKDTDEVIVPTNTFIATAWAPLYINSRLVFVDCDAESWTIDVSDVENKLTPNTKAVLGVHLYGQPFDVKSLKKLCRENDLILIEDCAQAHGATFEGKKVGKLGEYGCFSFYPSKNLGAYGEGGAITLSSKKNYDKLKMLQNHGSKVKYQHEILGFNMRMDNIQAAILSIKLKYLDKWLERKQEIANHYIQQINNPRIKAQKRMENSTHANHLFVISVSDPEKLKRALDDNRIGWGHHYPIPCHMQKALKHLNYSEGDFPNAEYLAKTSVSLPMYPELTDSDVERIVTVLNTY